MARVMVIGGGGLLGGEVVAAARRRGDEVIASARREREGWLRFDAERDDPADLFRERTVELVVNCAATLAADIATTGPETAELVNARFPHALVRCAAEAGARVVHISTDAVFAPDGGRALEDTPPEPADSYARTKLAGEPDAANALTLRTTFVGLDSSRHRGLLEWLLAQPAGSSVDGYVDQAWNGLASTQVASVCVALADVATFERARAEGRVHHLFEDPTTTKYELLQECARIFGAGVTVVPRESGAPVTRTLGTKHVTVAECLQCVPPRARALASLADRRKKEHV